MAHPQSLEERLALIEARNRRVEQDKAWETSRTRRLAVALVTYVCACVIFYSLLPTPNWALSAIVPVAGYLLSTLGLPAVRKVWERFRGRA